MCVERERKKNRQKSFDRQLCGSFSCPTCCSEGYDRWRQAFCTPQCNSQEGCKIIANLCSHLPAVCAQPCSPARGKLSSLTATNKYTHVLTGTCKYSDAAPCNSPRRTMDAVYIKMAASPIDISQSRRAIPQCNLHPTHLLHSLQIITCCAEAACMCVCLGTSVFMCVIVL